MALRKTRARVGDLMKDATSRSFKGGLNVADSELNLSSKYARVLDNLVVGIDGTIQVRQGSAIFADLTSLGCSYIIGMQYFAGNLIVVDQFGLVFSVDGTGTGSRIWDATIALSRRAGLRIWSLTPYMQFLEFNGQLILVNGTDKPLVITSALIVDYLADVTGSNINTPIGKIIEKHQSHVCIAVGSILKVSELNAGGSYTGDAGVVYAGTFDMKTYVTQGETDIIGLLSFKSTLLVMFRECIVPVTFVQNTAPVGLSVAVPEPSAIPNFGAISPHSVQNLGDTALSCDIVGVTSLQLSSFTRILSPDRPSRFVNPLLQNRIGNLTKAILYNDAFSVYDSRLGTYMLFFPNQSMPRQTRVNGFGYRFIENLEIKAWSTYSGWNWHCGTRSSEGNVFFAKDQSAQIYVMGDEITNPLNADFIGEQEMWSDDTPWSDQSGWNPITSRATSGVPIQFAWELPWTDLKARAHSKTLRYMIIDTEGTSEFTANLFIDDLYFQSDLGETFSDLTTFSDGTGWFRDTPLLRTALSANFVAKDRGGYGDDSYGALYGGGNNTVSRRLTLMPTKFNTLKLRLEGESTKPLKFVALTLMYQAGSIRRNPDV